MRANVSAFGILWLLKFIILNRSFAQIADTEPGAELRSAPGLRSGLRKQGRLGPRVRRTETTYGEESMTERTFVRGLGCRPNGGG